MSSSLNPAVRRWARWCHLSAVPGSLVSLLVPGVNLLLPYLIWSRKKQLHPLIADCGKESLNFQISCSIYLSIAVLVLIPIAVFIFFAATPSPLVLGLGGIVVLAIGLIYLAQTCFPILAAIRVEAGQRYRYPLTIRLLK